MDTRLTDVHAGAKEDLRDKPPTPTHKQPPNLPSTDQSSTSTTKHIADLPLPGRNIQANADDANLSVSGLGAGSSKPDAEEAIQHDRSSFMIADPLATVAVDAASPASDEVTKRHSKGSWGVVFSIVAGVAAVTAGAGTWLLLRSTRAMTKGTCCPQSLHRH